MNDASDPDTHALDENRGRAEAAFAGGGEINLLQGSHSDVDLARAHLWGSERSLRALDLMRILLAETDSNPRYPSRLIVQGARIIGKLDLGCSRVQPFWFRHCYFDQTPLLSDARAEFVGFTSCALPGLEANRLTCAGPIWLSACDVQGDIQLEAAAVGDFIAPNLKIRNSNSSPRALDMTGFRSAHGVNLQGASLSGSLGLRSAEVLGSLLLAKAEISAQAKQFAINGGQVAIKGSMAAAGINTTGELYLEGAIVNGNLNLSNSHLSNPGGRALDLDHASVSLGFHIRDSKVDGCISMHHSNISCQVSMARSTIYNPRGDAIRADHLTVDGAMILNGSMRVEGSITLHGAHIECSLNLHGMELSVNGDSRYGISADSCTVLGLLLCTNTKIRGGMDLRSSRVVGETLLADSEWIGSAQRPGLNLGGAIFEGGISGGRPGFRVTGLMVLADSLVSRQLRISDSSFDGAGFRAIVASGCEVKGPVVAERSRFSGTTDFANCEIHGDMRFAETVLTETKTNEISLGVMPDLVESRWRGRSLRLTSAVVAGDVDLRGTNSSGSLDLSGLVAKKIDLSDSELSDGSGFALDCDHLRAEAVDLRFTSSGESRVRLNAAQFGEFRDRKTTWDNVRELQIEDLVYDRVKSDIGLRDRLVWLEWATPTYAPDAYVKYAQSRADDGRVDEAREVRLHAIRREHAAGSASFRVWGFMQELLVGYGYRPWRALAWLLVVWLLGALYFSFGVASCVDGATRNSGSCPDGKSEAPNPILLSLDALLPFVSLGQLSGSTIGLASGIAVAGLTGAGLVLLSTIGAGLARVLRRP